MSWRKEIEATRDKVNALGGADMSLRAWNILDNIDKLLAELEQVWKEEEANENR